MRLDVQSVDGSGFARSEPLLDLLGEVYGLLDLESFQPGMLEALRRAVPADWVSLNSLGPQDGDAVAISVPAVTPPALYEAYAAHAHEHPVARHFARTGDGRPLRISDVATREELHSLALHREVYAVIGVEHQVAFTLPSPAGHLLAVALSRRSEDFSDAEVTLLGRARPHLIQAYRNALEYTALLRRLGEAPGETRTDLGAYGLTRREAEVVRRVASGLGNAHIARDLGVSERTVEKHLQRAYRKLGVRSRSEAARLAWGMAADRERRGGRSNPPYVDST
jgi:DNA-binding CsgD family transcriptional regulator